MVQYTDALKLAANTAQSYKVPASAKFLDIATDGTAQVYAKYQDGRGATFGVTATGSGPFVISAVAVNNAGLGYIVGDTFAIPGGANDTLGVVSITAVSSTGAITALTFTPGSYVSTPAGAAVSPDVVAAIPAAGITDGTGAQAIPAQGYRIYVGLTSGNTQPSISFISAGTPAITISAYHA